MKFNEIPRKLTNVCSSKQFICPLSPNLIKFVFLSQTLRFLHSISFSFKFHQFQFRNSKLMAKEKKKSLSQLPMSASIPMV